MPDAHPDGTGLHIHGEVALGFPPPPRTYARVAYGNTEPDVEKARWLTVRPDGSVIAYAGKVEYGQGIRAGLAIEVADELRVSLDSVEVVLGDTALVPWDMGTFGSQSTARVGVQLRKAAATARQALLDMAADRLDLPASDLTAADVAAGAAAIAKGKRPPAVLELLEAAEAGRYNPARGVFPWPIWSTPAWAAPPAEPPPPEDDEWGLPEEAPPPADDEWPADDVFDLDED